MVTVLTGLTLQIQRWSRLAMRKAEAAGWGTYFSEDVEPPARTRHD